MKDHSYEDGYAAETHTRVETYQHADGTWDFRVLDQNGNLLCSSRQGYVHEHEATRIASRVVHAGTLGDVTFGLADA